MSFELVTLEPAISPMLGRAADLQHWADRVRGERTAAGLRAQQAEWRSPAGQAMTVAVEHALGGAAHAASRAEALATALRHHHGTALSRARAAEQAAGAAGAVLHTASRAGMHLAAHLFS